MKRNRTPSLNVLAFITVSLQLLTAQEDMVIRRVSTSDCRLYWNLSFTNFIEDDVDDGPQDIGCSFRRKEDIRRAYEQSEKVSRQEWGLRGPTEENIADDANAGTSDEDKPVGSARKRKQSTNIHDLPTTMIKKGKKKPANVWAKATSRKGSKKHNKNGAARAEEEHMLLMPVNMEEKIEDGPGMPAVLSRIRKAEKIELSADRLSACSTKGYRMVMATRGVSMGVWYFEITVEKLGPTGHTRLGWAAQKAELQAPVGFDSHSYSYKDINGEKVHKAMPAAYGEGYAEGDVIGLYINLPDVEELTLPLIPCGGFSDTSEAKEESLKVLPGSEIAFFRNGVCQGTAFTDINVGRYFPAASMYTLPNEPNCVVRFCFGPDFKFPPKDIGQRPVPQPICFAPRCNIETQGPSRNGESPVLDAPQTKNDPL